MNNKTKEKNWMSRTLKLAMWIATFIECELKNYKLGESESKRW
ncbi:hypothetical protein [Echinicola sp. 20G]|nr:hypothetical protein [Echinicola sp. 20G]